MTTYKEFVTKAQVAIDKGNLDEAADLLAQAQAEQAKKLYTLYDLADDLHNADCRSNHTDMCGYFYEDGPNKWDKYTHKRYLEKAQLMARLLPDIALYDMSRVFKAIRN